MCWIDQSWPIFIKNLSCEIMSDELEYTQDLIFLIEISFWLKIIKVQSSNIPFLRILRIFFKNSILSSNSIFRK